MPVGNARVTIIVFACAAGNFIRGRVISRKKGYLLPISRRINRFVTMERRGTDGNMPIYTFAVGIDRGRVPLHSLDRSIEFDSPR